MLQRRVIIPPQLAELPTRLPLGKVLDVSGEAMGTNWTVKWVDEGVVSAESLTSRIEHVIARVVDEMSTWQEDAFISRFNRAPANSDFALPACFAHVLECAMQLAVDTDGAFDPTVGPLVNLWGFGPDRSITEPPTQMDIAAAQTLCGWRRIVVKDGYICQPGGLYLDFSGIAKGYSIDLIADSLRGQGIRNFLVEVGGELSGSGIKPDGQPWWVALETPESQRQDQQSIVALYGLAVATSGDYRRYFDHQNIRYSHTLDPRTGYPVADAPFVVSVLHSSCMHADALATALTVLGVQAGLEYAAHRNIAAIFTQMEAGKPVQYVSSAMLEMVEEV